MPPRELEDDAADDIPHRRRSDQGWLARLPGIYTLLLLTAFIFTSGISYRKLTETSEKLEAFVSEVRENYLRRDVAAEQNRRLEDRIDMLTNEVRYLSETLQRESEPTSRASGPKLGRK